MREAERDEVLTMFLGQAFCVVLAASGQRTYTEARKELILEQIESLLKLGDVYIDEWRPTMLDGVDLYEKILASLVSDSPSVMTKASIPNFSELSTKSIDNILGMGD